MPAIDSEADDRRRPRRRSGPIFWVVLLFGVVAILWVVSIFGPTSNELERYVTPPLDSEGTRIELLKPRGWEVTMMNPNGINAWAQQNDSDRFLVLQAPNTFGKFPRWLENTLPVWKRETGSLIITVTPSTRKKPLLPKQNVEVITNNNLGNSSSWNASMNWVALNERYFMFNSYNRSDKRKFNSTHTQVLRSISLFKGDKNNDRGGAR